jgi:recombination associated protein RdgC
MVYRIVPEWSATLEHVEQALDAARFVPCDAHQEQSSGWIEPRGQKHGALVESVAGQWVLRFMTESKAVPASVVRRKAQETLEAIEATTGRKPGKKEARDIRDDTLQALLPQAFTQQSSVVVWIDPHTRLLVMDATSVNKADALITSLVKHLPGMAMALVQTATTPQAAMTHWLSATEPDALPATLAVDRECELKSGDEQQSVVKFTRHSLDTDEVRQHIVEGKLPVKLALNWKDRVSFLLTEAMTLKRIKFLDGVLESDGDNASREDRFDADVAITTTELGQLLLDLIDALGGEGQAGMAAPVPGAVRPPVAAPAAAAGSASVPAPAASAQPLPWETDAQAASRQPQ